MKAYLIDPVLKQVTEVLTNGHIRSDKEGTGIYEHTRCSAIDIMRIDTNNHIYVDDDGLNNGAVHTYGMFVLTGTARAVPLAGYGIVLGSTRHGGEAEPTLSLEEVRAMVTFPTFDEIRERAMRGEFD